MCGFHGQGLEKDTQSPSDMLHEKLDDWWATDDVSGEPLDPGMVNAARREENAYVNSMGVYEKVP